MSDPLRRVPGLRKRIALRVPGLGPVLRNLDATREQRDRLLRDKQKLREELRDLRSAPVVDDVALERLRVELLQAPSLLARVATLKRVRGHARELLGHADSVWRFNSKLAGTSLARELGLRVPEKLSEAVPLEDLLLPEGRRCVVKPTGGASARGVVPLVPAEGGRWIDLFARQAGSRRWEEIREELAEVVASGRIESRFFLEEMVEGPSEHELPYDWKMICIGGQVQVIQCRDARNQRASRFARFRYWSADWQDLGRIHHPERIDPDLPRPQHPDELISAAEAVAGHIGVNFLRVDLFEDTAGVLFSELTPQPGGVMWFGDDLDRHFGAVWDRAEARSWAR